MDLQGGRGGGRTPRRLCLALFVYLLHTTTCRLFGLGLAVLPALKELTEMWGELVKSGEENVKNIVAEKEQMQ